MKTEFTIFKSRENANFTGSAVLNLDDLKKAIKTAQKAVTKRDDVLNGYLVLNVSKNYGVITSSAWGIHTLVYFPVEKAERDFSAVLSSDFISAIDAEKGKKIGAILRSCPCQIDLEYNGKKLEFENPRCDHYGIHVTCGHASFTLAYSDLKKAIERTAPCCGKDDGRYALRGILLDAHENSGIHFVSTDGCRMSVQTFEREINVNEQILISESNFRRIKNVFSGFNGDIEINADSSHVFFHAPLITVICEQLQGSFPGWESTFKQIRPDFSKITVKTAYFRKIEAMKKDITKENPTVIFHKIERMDAIGAAAEEKPENAEIIGGSENDFPDIAFNFNFLLDFSKYVTDEEIQITYKDEKSGAVFACKDWKCLIMPKDKFYSFERYSKRMKDLREELEKRQEEEKHAREAMDAKKAELDRIHAEMKTAEGDAWKELDKKACKIGGDYWQLKDVHYKKSSVLDWTKTDIKKCETLYNDLKKKYSEYFQKMESAVFVENGIISAADAPENDETTQEAKDTTPTEKAPEKQADATETAKEEQATEQKEEKPEQAPAKITADDIEKAVKEVFKPEDMEAAKKTIREAAEKLKKEAEAAKNEPWEAKLAKLVTEARNPEPEPENRSAAADQNATTAAEPVKTAAEPEPMEEKPEPERSGAEKPFEIGTYTTKKGKIKTSIRFFQPPTPAQIDALKSAWYWEYNGTWNGSPRKLPEIFKH